MKKEEKIANVNANVEEELDLEDLEQVSGGTMKGNIVLEETKPISTGTQSQIQYQDFKEEIQMDIISMLY